MGEAKGTAYLRELELTKQCELMFTLNTDLGALGLLQEEVKAIRQITDSVESLLQHIVNKIQKSIRTLKEERKDVASDEVAINVTLRNGSSRTQVNANMVLKNLIHSDMRNIEFNIFNHSYIVIINAPLVKDIKLPLILYADFTVQASRLVLLFAENNVSQFKWYKSKDKTKWEQVAKTSRYKIVEEDLGHYLKLVCVPCNSVLTGPSAEVVSENKVERIGQLPTCPFEKRHKFTTVKLNNNNFRLVSYNILSNRYADTNERFPYCSPKALAIDYRKQLITKELLGYQADIICLQEVDSAIYTSYYKDIFKNKGYMSFYHRKGNKIPEGLACFFNKLRFKKVDDHQIIYSEEIKQNRLFTYLWKFIKGNTELKELFMRQMTSLEITVLKTKMSDKNHYLIVANTHLFYRSDAELVRVVQVNMATTYLQMLHKQLSHDGNLVNVILCGDFNSVPTGAVYAYMTSGKLVKNHQVFEKSKNNIDLFHNFKFESACGVPKYTNYTDDFKECLDYIFIEKTKMKVNQIVPFPKEEELANYEGLPNDVFPSDHLALVTDLEIV